MVGLSKHKADTYLVDAGGNLLRRQGERNSSSFQDIGAAAETGHLSIAVLGNLGTGACRNEGRCGRDVKKFATTAAGTAGVDQGFTCCGYLCRQRAHGKGRTSDLFGGFALYAKRGKERTDLPRSRLAGHDLQKNGCRIILAKIVAFDDLSKRLRYVHRLFLSLQKIIQQLMAMLGEY